MRLRLPGNRPSLRSRVLRHGDSLLEQLDSSGLTGTYAGAGIGTWLTGAGGYIQALATKPRLDFIDLHVEPINDNLLSTTASLIDQAAATVSGYDDFGVARKAARLGISGGQYRGRSEYLCARSLQLLGAGRPAVSACSDQARILEKAGAAVSLLERVLRCVSALHAFNAALPYTQLRDAASQAASMAMQGSVFTSTGVAWQGMVSPAVTVPTMVSAANAQAGPVAPIHRQRFRFEASGNDIERAASSFAHDPGGDHATVADLLASLYFVSPGQVNAVVPAELAPGVATFQIGAPAGR